MNKTTKLAKTQEKKKEEKINPFESNKTKRNEDDLLPINVKIKPTGRHASKWKILIKPLFNSSENILLKKNSPPKKSSVTKKQPQSDQDMYYLTVKTPNPLDVF